MGKFLLLDDSPWVFDLYQEPLADLLEAAPEFLLHEKQSIPELVMQVAARRPALLLLDAQLANGVHGPEVLHAMLAAVPALRCIGFSSDAGYADAFLEAGAVGFVQKRRDNPRLSAREVAAVWKALA